jgi:uncharacterized phage protein (TIGR01671 family)
MNRKIKFRAWDGKKMIYQSTSQLKGSFIMFSMLGDVEGTKEIMQNTGLLDKQGKEIYEGDIVKLPKEDKCSGGCCKYEKDLGCWLSEVVWQCDGFQINNHGANHATEIIGNIYENKDLSKSKTGYAI